MDGSTLKRIALGSMIVDHAAIIIVYRIFYKYLQSISHPATNTVYHITEIMRMFGRLAFPIFCFLLVEGYFHTKNIRRYAARLLLFALISEIPFNLGIYNRVFYLKKQNVMFTLLIGLLVIWGCDRIRTKWEQSVYFSWFLQGAVIALGAFAGRLCRSDYQWYGVLLIVAFYYLRPFPRWCITLASVTLLWRSFEVPAIAAFILLLFYNGKRGKINQYLYYAAYPLHLLLLFLLGKLIPVFLTNAPL